MAKIRILIADDHILIRKGLCQVVKHEHDMEVVGEADDGSAAIDMVESLHPDVVLMDIVMPGLNGIQAAERIIRNHPSVKILFLSGYDNQEYISAVVGLHSAGYVLKNSDTKMIIHAIRSIIRGDSFMEPGVVDKMLYTLKTRKQRKPAKKGALLTGRELQVIKLGAKGLGNKDIAAYLHISVRTVHAHWRNIFKKLEVTSRMDAVMECLKKGFITA